MTANSLVLLKLVLFDDDGKRGNNKRGNTKTIIPVPMWITLIHAIIVSCISPIIFIYEAGYSFVLRPWLWPYDNTYFHGTTSILQSLVFMFSVMYFVYDSYMLLTTQ